MLHLTEKTWARATPWCWPPVRAVVVDAGPAPGPANRCLRALGVRQVPLVVLTHPHLDHVGGLPGVLRGRVVGAVVVSPGRVPEGEAGRVSRQLQAARIPECRAVRGMRWRFGPTEITVLAPEPGTAPQGTGEGSIANNASVVLLVRWSGPPGTATAHAAKQTGSPSGVRGALVSPAAGGPQEAEDASGEREDQGTSLGTVLLAGDLETEAQEALLRIGVPRVDVLKVPHHGSSRQAPAFLAATGARAALVSVGAVNDYGHPAQVTLRRLRGLGMRLYRTDLSGDIAVVAAHGHLAMVVRGR